MTFGPHIITMTAEVLRDSDTYIVIIRFGVIFWKIFCHFIFNSSVGIGAINIDFKVLVSFYLTTQRYTFVTLHVSSICVVLLTKKKAMNKLHGVKIYENW